MALTDPLADDFVLVNKEDMTLIEPRNVHAEGSSEDNTSMQENHHTDSVSLLEKETKVRRVSLFSLQKNIQRELIIRKHANVPFGAEFVNIFGRVIVCFIHEFVNLDDYSAAYRAGLCFGDEVLAINGQPIADLDGESIKELLFQTLDPHMDLCESPLIESFMVAVGEDGLLGIKGYSRGSIDHVWPESPAWHAKIEPGHSIVSINGKCTLGKSDTEMCELVAVAARPKRVIELSTMKTDLAMQLTDALKLQVAHYLEDALTPAQVVDWDFTNINRHYRHGVHV
eukprot:comp33842_c0_seq1/m.47292 comp33842_c0_seq1/g.47292  ORF comp33842_c0_seq1/g.47292 comp33842_c0_seq1/m.47292 type:complete len:284 (-) comp33842_c0_seq1:578-1429(-)